MTFIERVLSPFQSRASAENPSTGLANPALWLTELFGSKTKSGIRVSEVGSTALPAIWRAAELWSGMVASLPLFVYQRDGSNKEARRDHPLHPILHDKPNQYMTSFEWRRVTTLHALFWGNAYSLISERTGERATELLPWHPSKVQVALQDNLLWYIFDMGNGEKITVEQSNVVHIKGPGFDGILGKGRIQCLREMIGLGLASQETAGNFYANGLKMDGIIRNPGALSEDGLKLLRKTWNDTHGGTDAERIAVLDNGMEFQQLTMSPEDSQFLESRKFNVTEVSRAFSIPPPLLYDLEKATFSNITELIQTWIMFDVLPWLNNMEAEFNNKLLFEAEKKTHFTEFTVDALLRGNPDMRAKYYQSMHNMGAINANEIRSFENMNAYKGGNVFYRPLNMDVAGGDPGTNGQGTKKDVQTVAQ